MNALHEIRERAAHTGSTNRAERAQYREDHDRMLAALDYVLERCEHMDRSQPVGAWYYNEITGAISAALGGKP